MHGGTEKGDHEAAAGGLSEAVSHTLRSAGAAVHSDEYPVFYQGSVYLFVVYCKGIAGKWDSDRREAFLACDAEGFLCIWQDARDIRGKIMRNCGREPVL